MATKLSAARIATQQGIPMILMNGAQPEDLQLLWQGQCPGTLFLPKEHGHGGKKGWLAFGAKAAGKLWLDQGAERALREKGSSLLPSGILKVEGDFHRGDIVALYRDENEIARGFSNYSAQDISKIMGHHSREIASLLSLIHIYGPYPYY